MTVKEIDLNLDAGESAAALFDGSEAALYDLVTSVNVACGGHAGNAASMARAVRLAAERGLNIGAHPSYPDFAGFGRTAMNLSHEALVYSVLEQLENLRKAADGARLTHVKPHGALYNRAAVHEPTAAAVIEAVRRFDAKLAVMGLAGSPFARWCGDAGLRFLAEGFPDRRYESDGTTLRSRDQEDALITDPSECGRQAVALAAGPVDSLCVHGDSPGALRNARAIRDALTAAGVRMRPFAPPALAP